MIHGFFEPAIFEEVFFEFGDLFVEEVVGLVDEAEGDVGDDLGRASSEEFAVGFVGFVWFATEFADVEGLWGVFVPGGLVTDPEVVVEVFEKFFQGGPSDVGEVEFHLGGGDGCFAAFEDVLFAGAGRLDHLINGAIPSFEVTLGEAEGEVVDDEGLSIGEEFPVVAFVGEEMVVRH